MGIHFLLNVIGMGLGLAADAFSVAFASGIQDIGMSRKKANRIALYFGFFQFLMPLLGYLIFHLLANCFVMIMQFVPWLSFFILTFLGLKLILEKPKSCSYLSQKLLSLALATSIDALSVGLMLATYTFLQMLVAAIIIGLITYLLCLVALIIGRKIGQNLLTYATIVAGFILISIGIGIIFNL